MGAARTATVIIRNCGNCYFGVSSWDRRTFPGVLSLPLPNPTQLPSFEVPRYPRRWGPQKVKLQPLFKDLFSYHLSLNVRRKTYVLHAFSITRGPNMHPGNYGENNRVERQHHF